MFFLQICLSGLPAKELMVVSDFAFMRYIKIDNKQAADRLRKWRKL